MKVTEVTHYSYSQARRAKVGGMFEVTLLHGQHARLFLTVLGPDLSQASRDEAVAYALAVWCERYPCVAPKVISVNDYAARPEYVTADGYEHAYITEGRGGYSCPFAGSRWEKL